MQPAPDESPNHGMYLTFRLGEEEYGLALHRVREIIALIDITPVPNTPSYLRGVMNLRGQVIPVIDLRVKLAMSATPDHERKCIIVVDTEDGDGRGRSSILVDDVSEVLLLAASDIADPAQVTLGPGTDFIEGVARTTDGKAESSDIKILINIDNVIAVAEDEDIDTSLALAGTA